MKKEIEVLFQLDTVVTEALAILEKKFGPPEIRKTIDDYFFDPIRKNLQPEVLLEDLRLRECLRLRDKGEESFITYKTDHFGSSNEWLYSDELEMRIGDIEGFRLLFDKLGFKLLTQVKCTKYYYHSEMYEVAIEEVEKLGNFVEVEYVKEVEEEVIDQIKDMIRNFISECGLRIGSELNSGKPELMLNKFGFASDISST